MDYIKRNLKKIVICVILLLLILLFQSFSNNRLQQLLLQLNNAINKNDMELINSTTQKLSSYWFNFIFTLVIESLKCILITYLVTFFDYSENYQKLSNQDKAKLIKKIITPPKEKEIISKDIDNYISSYCEKIVGLYNTNFRTNYTIISNAFLKDGKIILKSIVKYREHKVCGNFCNLYSGYEFETDTTQDYSIEVNGKKYQAKTKVFHEGDQLPLSCTLSFDDALVKIEEHSFDLEVNNYDSIYVTRDYIETTDFDFKMFTLRLQKPCMGLDIIINCSEDLEIVSNNFISFGDFNTFNKRECNEHTFSCDTHKWMNAGLGFAIPIKIKKK